MRQLETIRCAQISAHDERPELDRLLGNGAAGLILRELLPQPSRTRAWSGAGVKYWGAKKRDQRHSARNGQITLKGARNAQATLQGRQMYRAESREIWLFRQTAGCTPLNSGERKFDCDDWLPTETGRTRLWRPREMGGFVGSHIKEAGPPKLTVR